MLDSQRRIAVELPIENNGDYSSKSPNSLVTETNLHNSLDSALQ